MPTPPDQFTDEMGTPRPDCSDAVGELVRLHYADVYRFAYRLAGNQGDAEDLTQQAFLTACRKLDQLRDLNKARAWLFTIARNAYLKGLRHETVEMSTFEDAVLAVDEPEEFDLDLDEEALAIALQGMPEAYRTPILLYYFEEMEYREIAESMDVPIGTVMSRLSRGKKYLRSELAQKSEPAATPTKSDGGQPE